MTAARDYSGDLSERAPPAASGRHMIGTFEALAASTRDSAATAKELGDDEEASHFELLAEILETAALCILNEAARADRAERRQ